MKALEYFFDCVDLSEYAEHDWDISEKMDLEESFILKARFVQFAKDNGHDIAHVAYGRGEAKTIASKLALAWFKPKAQGGKF